MALPIVKHATYFHTLFDGTKIEYRGFTTGEEKILAQLLVTEKDQKTYSEEKLAKAIEQQMNGIRRVVESCCITQLDFDKLHDYDIQDLFLRMREVSIDTNLEVQFICNHDVSNEDEEYVACKTPIKMTIATENIKVQHRDGKEPVYDFEIDDVLSIRLKYPSMIENMQAISSLLNSSNDAVTNDIEACTEFVYETNGDEVYYMHDESRESKDVFFNSISLSVKQEITDKFFGRKPSVLLKTKVVCPKCKNEKDFVIDDINSLFI